MMERTKPGSVDAGTPLSMPTSRESQDAVFQVSFGWCGGMGEAVIDEGGRMLFVDDLPVSVHEHARQTIMAHVEVPSSFSGQPVIKVRARVRMEERTDMNYTTPEPIEVTYLALSIDSLGDVFSAFEA